MYAELFLYLCCAAVADGEGGEAMSALLATPSPTAAVAEDNLDVLQVEAVQRGQGDQQLVHLEAGVPPAGQAQAKQPVRLGQQRHVKRRQIAAAAITRRRTNGACIKAQAHQFQIDELAAEAAPADRLHPDVLPAEKRQVREVGRVTKHGAEVDDVVGAAEEQEATKAAAVGDIGGAETPHGVENLLPTLGIPALEES